MSFDKSILSGVISKPEKKRRRPHTRASKACEFCRQQKTRCLRSDNSIACLRCLSLNLNCSLLKDHLELNLSFNSTKPIDKSSNNTQSLNNSILPPFPFQPQLSISNLSNDDDESSNNINENQDDSNISNKILEISSDVKLILQLLNNKRSDNNLNLTSASIPLISQSLSPSMLPSMLPTKKLYSNLSEQNQLINLTNFPTQSQSLSPLTFLKNLSFSLLPKSLLRQSLPPHFKPIHYTDVISIGLLNYKQAHHLLSIFRDRYNRWISLPNSINTKKLLNRIRQRCPLLLTVSCALSLKYGDPWLKNRIWNDLLKIIRIEVLKLCSGTDCGLEELQCLVILSIYCVGMSDDENKVNGIHDNIENELSIDGWYLSGVAMGLFNKLNGFGMLDQMYGSELEKGWKASIITMGGNVRTIEVQEKEDNLVDDDEDDDDEDENSEFNLLSLHRIWNTLLMVQLAYCLIYGRKSWFSIEMLKPKDVFDLSIATNFDYRIIAESHIYFICYKFFNLNENFEITKSEVKDWLTRWNYLFNKKSNEFVEIDYHFTEILINLKYYKIELKESNLNFLINNENSVGLKLIKFHATKVTSLINSIQDDSYFAFLSDQMHLIVFYSTNILIKVLKILIDEDKNKNFNDSDKDKGKGNAKVMGKRTGNGNIKVNLRELDKKIEIANGNENENDIEIEIIENENVINDQNEAEDKVEDERSNELIINFIKKLIFRFRKVATTNTDPFYKYSIILEKNFRLNFPDLNFRLFNKLEDDDDDGYQ